MNMNDLVPVSVDDHLVEPPDMFKDHIPAKYKDDVPKCDYPHSDSTWPLAPENLDIYLDGLPDNEIDRITHENAMRL